MKLLFKNLHQWCTVLFLGLSLGTMAQNAVKDTNPINDIMLQSFGWDEYKQSRHAAGFYNFYLNQADYLNDAGFDMIWMPPPSQSTGGVGYIPTKLFNFSKTSWGTEAELKAVLAKFKSKGMYSLADVVVNHRGGTTSWTDFTEPAWSCKTICSTDEASRASFTGVRPCGSADTGDDFDGGRDLDHTQQETRDGVKEYLNVMKALGFDGWRWDVAKGFSAQYFGEYNSASKPYYSVGEYWDGNGQALKGWIDGTTKNSGAFDFSNYYTLTNALKWNSYGSLNAGGRMPGVAGYIGYDDKAVTFVDNHDTFVKDEAILGDNVMKGYAYILTHPGIPCVWAAHYYGGSYTKDGVTRTYSDNQTAINKLMAVRKQNGINAYSSVNISQAGGTYVAYVSPTFGSAAAVVVKLGGGNFDPGTGWILNASGTDYAVWSKKTVTVPNAPDEAKISIGLIGSGTTGTVAGWDKDVVMTSTDNENYTLVGQTLFAGEVKFRANAAWSLNWGGTAFPSGTGTLDSAKNIPVTAGKYTITFNRKTAVYKFELTGSACTCPALDAPVCANGVTYKNSCEAECAGKTVYTTGACPVEVDPCTLCTNEVAPVCADGVEYSNACKAKCAGKTNYTTGACTVVVDPTYPKIGLIGSATSADTAVQWKTDVDMVTKDGVNYTLNIALLVGEAKFRQDDAWTKNWGDVAFPSGTGVTEGKNIPVNKAGTYDVAFNVTTGAYTFTLKSGDPVCTCTAEVAPVCADGVQYNNACEAKCAGKTVYTTGACVKVCTDKKIGMIGSATSADKTVQWVTDVDMCSTDGVTYKLTYTFLEGEAKFRKDDAWTSNWGDAAFPTGTGTQDGKNIVVKAGTYDVTFNATTGAYSFTEGLSRSDFNKNEDLVNIKVYPNPSQSDWNISSEEKIVSVSVLNSVGGTATAAVTISDNNATISGVNLTEGIYFAVIKTINSVKTIKLAKQ